jgi:hypothetical protein
MEELFDEDLKEVMGEMYEGGESAGKMPEMKRCHRFEKNEPVPAAFEPAPFDAEFMKRLTGCAKWSMCCGGVAALLWWFQMNDLMEIQASYPCILACALLAGYGVGKNVVK